MLKSCFNAKNIKAGLLPGEIDGPGNPVVPRCLLRLPACVSDAGGEAAWQLAENLSGCLYRASKLYTVAAKMLVLFETAAGYAIFKVRMSFDSGHSEKQQ